MIALYGSFCWSLAYWEARFHILEFVYFIG